MNDQDRTTGPGSVQPFKSVGSDDASIAPGKNIPDYHSMPPGDMLAAVGMDAMKWTDAFMQIATRANPLGRALRGYPDSEHQEALHGTMLGWFANAIMAGFDQSRNEAAARAREIDESDPVGTALALATEQFRAYAADHKRKAEMHRHKAEHAEEPARENRLEDAIEADRKAKVNEDMADMIENALLAHTAGLPVAVIEPGEGMTRYVGTKAVNAKPLTRGDWCALRGWTVPADENPADAGYLVEYADGQRPNVEGFEGYVSWSPADVFEQAYRPQ